MGRLPSDRKKIILKLIMIIVLEKVHGVVGKITEGRYKRKTHALLSRTLDYFISRLCFAFCFVSLIDGYTFSMALLSSMTYIFSGYIV